MKSEKVKKEIRRIASIKDPKKSQEEIKELDYILHEQPKIKKITRINYYDFYEVKGYDDAWDWVDPCWEIALERYFQNYKTKIMQQISDDDLTEIPEKLKEAIITRRDNPAAFTKEMYQNIYHNLLRKNPEDFEKIAIKYSQKFKLAKIFQQIEI